MDDDRPLTTAEVNRHRRALGLHPCASKTTTLVWTVVPLIVWNIVLLMAAGWLGLAVALVTDVAFTWHIARDPMPWN